MPTITTLLLFAALFMGCGKDAPAGSRASASDKTLASKSPAASDKPHDMALSSPRLEFPKPDVEALRARCDISDADACFKWAMTFEPGSSSLTVKTVRHRILEKACSMWHNEACFELALIDVKLGDKISLEQAIGNSAPRPASPATAASDNGDPSDPATQAMLKKHHYKAASVLLEKACTTGLSKSCVEVGDMQRDGRNATLTPDPEKAKRYYAIGCYFKEPRACDR
jgi:hypothetical protein